MAKRLSENQKKEIVKSFLEGQNIDQLSKKFNFTKLTISRNLKKSIGDETFLKINSQRISEDKLYLTEQNSNKSSKNNYSKDNLDYDLPHESQNKINDEEKFYDTSFVEIEPLNLEIADSNRKDLSSVPISEIEFPQNVYMIVDKKIELETKFLKDFPDWQFLPKEELNRKTIEIYFDLKKAKRFCNKDQKVIKVPNTDVFEIAAPKLLSRGISRIVSADKLIALEK